MKIRLLYIILFFSCHSLFAQENKDIITSTVRYHYGAVLSHHKSISYLVNDQISAIELNLGFIPSTERVWSRLYKQPEIGLGLYHGSLGNDKILGNVTAIFPYINFPLKRGKRWAFNTQMGFGLGISRKHFDPIDNYTNLAIGTKFNAFFKLLANGSYSINEKWGLNGGIGFNHISNGAISAPNKGLNLLTGTVGVQYNWNDKIPYKGLPKFKAVKLRNELSVIWGNGIKQVSEKDHHNYYTSSLSGNYSIGINSKQRVGLGIDFFYNKAANRGKWDFDPETSFKNRFSQAFFISHDLAIEKFSIIANIGIYTFYKTTPEKPIYTRLGLRYRFGEHLVTSLCLKAHMGKADFIEWGIGYRIKRNKNEK
ncbi:acyloxyacyl hydrolase [Labilibaculum sp. DW002]|uniref:Acyloxyacyl hydrolase n=1 Tax=Paralabilibaculum antarcticum TaxID=2912572 RepID=A0ABT5VUA5_9BACT|nr:acyloxyacyl hydrolase [Labilibaculum sp. DW002]MDE5418999.1 acyloxyacyl hydrolase [Labilibaculum sp. DW002]